MYALKQESVGVKPNQRSIVRRALGLADYDTVWRAMRAFTEARSAHTPDEIWLVEHPPVYTMGLKGRGGAVHDIHGIPLRYTDRGGDMTYHGPGQIVMYVLLDLGRLGIGIKTLVHTLEQTLIDTLAERHIHGDRLAGAPGVYVDGKKIAALGLRLRRGCSYHGVALNVEMDLKPFTHIRPCGYAGMQVTQLADFGAIATPVSVGHILADRLVSRLGYNLPVTLLPSDLTRLAPSHE